MYISYQSHKLLLFVLLLACLHSSCEARQHVTSQNTASNLNSSTCEYGTANYITHTLPQQCLQTSWPGGEVLNPSVQNASATSHTVVAGFTTPLPSRGPPPASSQANNEIHRKDPDPGADGDPTARTFMSFEDWKELMLRRAGQDPNELRSRKAAEDHIDPERRGNDGGGLDSLGDEGEISLNFDTYSEKNSGIGTPSRSAATDSLDRDQQQETVLYDDGRTQYYRSKDAGKTCKERFSYSSFDAGATVLKTNQGAKNSKAILVENKDSYMLLECAADNKFVIVELTDDILVDTIVLANFEFFSSMIRQFRVSVSDRYPVKVDKWKELGIFEAKNSRDIQPFLVENPLIWAKYVRIEFLTHYGNEYYCPVSLLRVHGTRMLESWKETEAAPDEDELEEPSSSAEVPTYELSGTPSNASVGSDLPLSANHSVQEHAVTNSAHSMTSEFPVSPLIIAVSTCMAAEADILQSTNSGSADLRGINTDTGVSTPYSVSQRGGGVSIDILTELNLSVQSSSTIEMPGPNTTPSKIQSPAHVEATGQTSVQQPASELPNEEPRESNYASIGRAPASILPRNKTTSTASASPASPTIQESFFKAITKRLQLLESNVTLSLKYMEDQSRFLQEVQQAAEKKQLSRVDTFLDNLNRTVLSELRNVRQQYDQIWQSTIIALESQREQSRRETMALSSRLNILAEEVVFQKRMAIIQAILLLSCLVLVIFSRSIVHPIIPSQFELDMASNPNYARPWFSLEPTSRQAFAYNSYEGAVLGSRNDQSTGVPSARNVSQGQDPLLPVDDYIPLTPSSGIGQRFIHNDYRSDLGSPATIQLDQLSEDLEINDDFSTSATIGMLPSTEQTVSTLKMPATDQDSSCCPSLLPSTSDTGIQIVPLDGGDVPSKPAYRRQNSAHATISRKPLPALPEHPI